MRESKPHTLDLHGLTWAEAEATFIEFYNQQVNRAGQNTVRIDVVHGYGSTGSGGVLCTRLRAFLSRYPSQVEFHPGEKIDGNPGHTIVVPLKPLPALREQLLMDILAYCETPRSQSKIIGKFRRQGEMEVLRAIKTLERQKRLRLLARGAVKRFQA